MAQSITAKECKFEVIKLIAHGCKRATVLQSVVTRLMKGGYDEVTATELVNESIELVTKDVIIANF